MAEETPAERLAEPLAEPLAVESVPMTFIRVLGSPYLRAAALRCIASIFRYFFLPQYRASFLPGRVPVSRADHPLDSKIPFTPGKVNVYLDFVAFWIRSLGFLLRTCGRRALEPVRHFLETMGKVYGWAAEVYRKNLSTTERPFYIGRLRFFLIHATDPHLMCIPSLHVMVVIRTYTLFKEMSKTLGGEKRFAAQEEELYRGALAITEAVLFVKQHSVNCIPAALYAITRFDPRLFPPDEGERFLSGLFNERIRSEEGRIRNEEGGIRNEELGIRRGKEPNAKDAEEIRLYILTLYRRFLAQGEGCEDWTKPLLDFLKELLQK